MTNNTIPNVPRELEGLLLRTYEHAPIPLQCRIDASLSAGKG